MKQPIQSISATPSSSSSSNNGGTCPVCGARKLRSLLISSERAAARRMGITDREAEIVIAICDGLCTKEIGHKLNVSPKAIEYHRLRAMKKLNVNSYAMLVRLAIRNKLVQA